MATSFAKPSSSLNRIVGIALFAFQGNEDHSQVRKPGDQRRR
jgi:hypothetical protein